MQRLICLFITLLLSTVSFAATTESVSQESVISADDLDLSDLQEPDFEVEAALAINGQTERTDGSPMLGATFLFRLNEQNRLGLRTFLPTSSDAGEGSYSMEANYRYQFKPSQNTLFGEFLLGINSYGGQYFDTMGLGLGALYKINDTLSIGGTGEWIYNMSNQDMFPRLSAFVSAGI